MFLNNFVFLELGLFNEVTQSDDYLMDIVGYAPFFISHYFEIDISSIIEVNDVGEFSVAENLGRTKWILSI
jgi:hypothetical protein